MRFFDLINFDKSQLKHSASFYGFSSIYSTEDVCLISGKNRAEDDPRLKIFMGDTNSILKNLRRYDVFYSTSYEASLELFAKAKEQEKPFMVCLSDMLLAKNPSLSMYRVERFARVARHYDIELVGVSFAKEEHLIRSPSEAGSLLGFCGLTSQQAQYSYSLLGDMIEDKLKNE